MRNIKAYFYDCGASIAVEFALVAPMFLFLVFGIVSYSTIIGINHSIQQLASESARASLAGMTDTERDSLARSFVSTNSSTYEFIDSSKIVTSTSLNTGMTNGFRVSIQYDMSTNFIYRLFGTLPLPGPTIVRSAVIQRSGY